MIDNDDMLLNDAGRMINEIWREMPEHHPGIALDVMQIMPNHLHGIIVVCEVGTDPRVCPNLRIENGRKTQVGLRIVGPLYRNGFTVPGNGRAQGPSPTTLSDVVRQFKTLTARRYIEGVNNHGWHSFSGKLWQRSYHDRIIRNETELNKIRTYICNNPGEWDTDENNIELKEKAEQADSLARLQRS